MSARVNLDYTVSTKIRFSADVVYTHIDNRNLYNDYSNNTKTRIRDVAYQKMPNQAVFEYDEYGNITSNFFSPAVTAQGTFINNSTSATYNALAMALSAENHQLGERLLPTLYCQIL